MFLRGDLFSTFIELYVYFIVPFSLPSSLPSIIIRLGTNDALNRTGNDANPFVRANRKLAGSEDDLQVQGDVDFFAHSGDFLFRTLL